MLFDGFNVLELITVLSSVGCFGLLAKAVKNFCQGREDRARRLIIGVVGVMPAPLSPYQDFTDVHKAIRSGLRVCIVHCTLEIGLRYCDFVVADVGSNPKVIHPDDIHSLLSILPDHDDDKNTKYPML